MAYEIGDKITLEHPDGSRLVREVLPPLSPRHDKLRVRSVVDTNTGLSLPVATLLGLGWNITAVEPGSTVPTEPGWYLLYDKLAEKLFTAEQRDGALWFGYPEQNKLGDPERFGPFVPLEAVPITVERIIKWAEFADWSWGSMKGSPFLRALAAEFGVGK